MARETYRVGVGPPSPMAVGSNFQVPGPWLAIALPPLGQGSPWVSRSNDLPAAGHHGPWSCRRIFMGPHERPGPWAPILKSLQKLFVFRAITQFAFAMIFLSDRGPVCRFWSYHQPLECVLSLWKGNAFGFRGFRN